MDSPTVKLESRWRDRERREAELSFHFPFSLSLPNLVAQATNILNLVSAMSDAVLVSYQLVWRSTIDTPGVAGVSSDVRSFVGLFYSNEEGNVYETIWIPSPIASIFEGQGQYAGLRVEASSPSVASFISGAVVGSLATLEGASWPQVYIVGGLRL